MVKKSGYNLIPTSQNPKDGIYIYINQYKIYTYSNNSGDTKMKASKQKTNVNKLFNKEKDKLVKLISDSSNAYAQELFRSVAKEKDIEPKVLFEKIGKLQAITTFQDGIDYMEKEVTPDRLAEIKNDYQKIEDMLYKMVLDFMENFFPKHGIMPPTVWNYKGGASSKRLVEYSFQELFDLMVAVGKVDLNTHKMPKDFSKMLNDLMNDKELLTQLAVVELQRTSNQTIKERMRNIIRASA